jgi:aspartate/glutamate racemase
MLTFDAAVASLLTGSGTRSFVLLGTSKVANLGAKSIYAPLARSFAIEKPQNQAAVDALIIDIKRKGGAETTVVQRMNDLLATFQGRTVVLACTDFPTVPMTAPVKTRLIDPTDALAAAMIKRIRLMPR